MKHIRYSLLLTLSFAMIACGDDAADDNASPPPGAPIGDTLADGGEGGAGDPADSGDIAPIGDSGAEGDGGVVDDEEGACPEANDGVASCKDEREALLQPVDKVTEGEVVVVSEDGATRTLYVDASAGGAPKASENPYVYIHLSSGERVEVTDKSASSSLGWDIAIKRASFLTNSGHAGPGKGGALFLAGHAFEAVTSEDAASAPIPQERLFDEACAAQVDGRGAPVTTFDGWYAYDPVTHATPPADGTFLVRGADCALFKVRIDSNTATPEGGTDGVATGRYLLRVAAL